MNEIIFFIQSLLALIPCSVSKTDHALRTQKLLSSNAKLKESIENSAFHTFQLKDCWEKPVTRFNQMDYDEIPNGATGSIATSGCTLLVLINTVFFLFPLTEKEKYYIVENAAKIIAEKGYRMWKYGNLKESFGLPRVHTREELLSFLKKIYPEKYEICQNKSLEEIYAEIGSPCGIGISQHLLTAYFGDQARRVESLEEMISEIESGKVIICRVDNSKFYSPDKTGGHYVLLVGFKNNYAIILDPMQGIVQKPFIEFLDSMNGPKGVMCAIAVTPGLTE